MPVPDGGVLELPNGPKTCQHVLHRCLQALAHIIEFSNLLQKNDIHSPCRHATLSCSCPAIEDPEATWLESWSHLWILISPLRTFYNQCPCSRHQCCTMGWSSIHQWMSCSLIESLSINLSPWSTSQGRYNPRAALASCSHDGTWLSEGSLAHSLQRGRPETGFLEPKKAKVCQENLPGKFALRNWNDTSASSFAISMFAAERCSYGARQLKE